MISSFRARSFSMASSLVAGLLFVAFGAACSGDDGGTGGGGAGGGATTSDATSTTSTGTPVVCNDLELEGEPVTPLFLAEDPPAATGGEFVPGPYVLQGFEVYTGPGGKAGVATGHTARSVVVFAGDTMQSVSQFDDEGAPVTYTDSFVVSGTEITTTQSCPVAEPAATVGYSMVGAAGLAILVPNEEGTAVLTYVPDVTP